MGLKNATEFPPSFSREFRCGKSRKIVRRASVGVQGEVFFVTLIVLGSQVFYALQCPESCAIGAIEFGRPRQCDHAVVLECDIYHVDLDQRRGDDNKIKIRVFGAGGWGQRGKLSQNAVSWETP